MNRIGFWLVVQALFLAAAAAGGLARAETPQRDTGLARVIAAQGNAAVRAIRADAREAVRRQVRMEIPAAAPQVAVRS